MGGYAVGVLVQTNYSGVLKVAGAPVGQELGRYYLMDAEQAYQSGGSIVIIIATDAPLSDRNLRRLARRAFIGVGNTGSSMANGSGDYALAFATAEVVRRTPARRREAATIEDLPNDKISPLFQAVAEATEEAVYNAMLQATSTTGVDDHRLDALPLDRLREILARKGIGGPTR